MSAIEKQPPSPELFQQEEPELLRSTIVHYEQEIHYLKDCVEKLTEQVAIYKNLAFGVKSERYIQVSLDVEEALEQEFSKQETTETAPANSGNEEDGNALKR